MTSSAWWLYAAAVGIWGSTWLVITFQLGTVAPEVSVAVRFAVASALLFLYARWKRMPLLFSGRMHLWLVAQGLFLFCINYVLFYHAERFISSGLVALICSAMVFINIIGMRVFFAQRLSRRVMSGSLLGVVGIVLVFWPEVAAFKANALGWTGIQFAAVATLSASAGNLVSVKQRRLQIPLIPSMAWAMAYGVLLTSIYILWQGIPLTFDTSIRYLTSLLYLVLFGSIAAFLSYLTLIARVGADKAAYVNVTVPIVALFLSAMLEGFQWQFWTWAGIACGLLGNVLVMTKPTPRA